MLRLREEKISNYDMLALLGNELQQVHMTQMPLKKQEPKQD